MKQSEKLLTSLRGEKVCFTFRVQGRLGTGGGRVDSASDVCLPPRESQTPPGSLNPPPDSCRGQGSAQEHRLPWTWQALVHLPCSPPRSLLPPSLSLTPNTRSGGGGQWAVWKELGDWGRILVPPVNSDLGEFPHFRMGIEPPGSTRFSQRAQTGGPRTRNIEPWGPVTAPRTWPDAQEGSSGPLSL